mmetsp:Transcript_23221/g.66969  ORF Transcript_23221/g.66969 Transcript_23221/m.66969 type:complete len:567 (-) Transcript_23221:33-1733(-)
MSRGLAVLLLDIACCVSAGCAGEAFLDSGAGCGLLQVRHSLLVAERDLLETKSAGGSTPSAVAANRTDIHLTEANVTSIGMQAVARAALGENDINLKGIARMNLSLKNSSQVIRSNLQDVIKQEEFNAVTKSTLGAPIQPLAETDKVEVENQDNVFKKTLQAEEPNVTIQEELNNKTIQNQILKRVEEAIDQEVEDTVVHEHRLPTQSELNQTVNKELRDIWSDLLVAHRHRHGQAGDHSFWASVAFFDWCLLAIAVAAFLTVYHMMLEWPSTRSFHGAAILVWVAMAAMYNTLIYMRQGESPSLVWLTGYLLEFIFSIENLFVFHIIVKAFRMPRWITQRVLFHVLIWQLAFQGVFYLGLAHWLRSLVVLPYLLGVWLLYVGVQACMEDDHADFDIMKTKPVAFFQWCLGDRLQLVHDGTAAIFVTKGDRTRLSPVGLQLLCLLLADFLLEVDVTITKIETFPSRYICFSSSVVASFAMPELFFVARDLFSKFFALKYGIGFVLVFCGVQSLLHKFFTLSALASLAVILGVITISILVSILLRLGRGYIGTDEVGPPEEEPRAAA